MENWIILSLIYGLLCGTSDIIKKQVLKKISVLNTLVIFNLVVLIILTFQCNNYALSITNFPLIAIKSLSIFFAWLISFYCIKNIQISYYSILMLSKVVFSGILSIIFLRESIELLKIIGFIVICIGIIISNIHSKKNGVINIKFSLLTLLSAFLISVSLLLDKVVLKTVSENVFQFYYTIVLTILYLIYIIFKKEKLDFKCVVYEPNVVSLGIVMFLSDYTHFLAAATKNSSVVVMTLLRHSSLIITVVAGSFLFKEKNKIIKFVALLIVILGLVLTIL